MLLPERHNNIEVPNKIKGEEPTRLQGDVYTFADGRKIGVFWEHRDNEGPKLHEIRNGFVNGLHIIFDLAPGQFRYMEFEKDFGNPYREFMYQANDKGGLSAKYSEFPRSEEAFQRLLEREERDANQKAWSLADLVDSPERVRQDQGPPEPQRQEAPDPQKQEQEPEAVQVPRPRLDDYEPQL